MYWHARQAGGSLAGVMVAVAILALLLGSAAPAFSTWQQSAQIRTAAESLRDGLQFARMEAVRRNGAIEFRLLDAAGRTDWEVGCPQDRAGSTCPARIQSRSGQEGSAQARIRIAVAEVPLASVAQDMPPLTLVFSGMGRLSAAGRALPARLDVVHAGSAGRRLVLLLSPGGRARLCDPAVAQADSAGGCG